MKIDFINYIKTLQEDVEIETEGMVIIEGVEHRNLNTIISPKQDLLDVINNNFDDELYGTFDGTHYIKIKKW